MQPTHISPGPALIRPNAGAPERCLIHLKAHSRLPRDHRAMSGDRLNSAASRLPYVAQVPFRAFFLLGVVQLLLVITLWLAELGARTGLWPAAPLPWPAGTLHAASLVYGVFPFFVFGFSFNAFPKWHKREAPTPTGYLIAALLLAAGWLGVYAAIAFGGRLDMAFAPLLGGWALGWLLQIDIVRGPGIAPWQTRGVTAATGLGGIGLLLLVRGMTQGDGVLIHAAIALGTWGFAAPLFFCAAQRVIPMFDSFVVPRLELYQPPVGLLLVVGSLLAHAVCLIAGGERWTALPDAIAALVLWQHVARWPLRAIWAQRVLAMLHVGFMWFAAALSLNVVATLTGLPAGGHALYLGAFGSLLFAMATRVTQGRIKDKTRIEMHAWALFRVLQLAVLARVAADVLPAEAARWAHLLAAALSLGAFCAWAAQNMRSYLR